MNRGCESCGEQIDIEEFDFCPYCGEETPGVLYGVIYNYNYVPDTQYQDFESREEALEYAEERIHPENNPDDYDWKIKESDDDDTIFYAGVGRYRQGISDASIAVKPKVDYSTVSPSRASDEG